MELHLYSVIDLFSGAGGLSLGFKQTGKFNIKAAFENNPPMRESYHKNFPDVELYGDVCSANYNDILKKHGAIDVVIGGPPCQGFSNANRQKNHVINQNNMLVKQYVRAILELKPKAFVMENVSMLTSNSHRFYMEKGDADIINKYNIPIEILPLPLLDKKFKFENDIEIIKDLNKIEHYLWPVKDYCEINVIYKGSRNIDKMKRTLKNHKRDIMNIAQRYISSKSSDHIEMESKKAFQSILDYYSNKISAEEIRTIIEPSIMIQRMLSKSKEIFDNNIVVDEYYDDDKSGIVAKIKSFSVFDYLKKILESPEHNYVINSDVICAADYGVPQTRKRFILIGVNRSISSVVKIPKGNIDSGKYHTVRDAISDLEDINPVFSVTDDENGIPISPKKNIGKFAKSLRDSSILKNHIITKTGKTAMERFCALEQGKNFHSLENQLKTNTYSDVSRTQNTIYLRLDYNNPSGTVVNVRKSMWVHPTKDRAVSIREAARLQTFPDSFVFCGTKDNQYQQVGNAVPPLVSKSIAIELSKVLSKES